MGSELNNTLTLKELALKWSLLKDRRKDRKLEFHISKIISARKREKVTCQDIKYLVAQ
jgi:hypothetical protein